jgi:DNA repair exonuclease SbcCD ATPase subunit
MDWEKFINSVFECSKGVMGFEDIRSLLDISKHEHDNPHTQGKMLIINRLKFTGSKNNGDRIDFDKKFFTGVNVVFADNNKGKSSIFKIIKFALTGDKSSIKKDVYGWLKKVILEFQLNNTTFTIYIDLTNPRVKSGLYKSTIDALKICEDGKVKIEKILVNFEENTEQNFKDKMQEFFFEQFSYYNLFWTSSNKQSLELQDNSTSWKTYYKSIYLESKDYNVLFLTTDFGSQNKKILEMILGLKYTALINSWKIQLDYLKHESNKKDLFKDEMLGINEEEKMELQKELEDLQFRIEQVKIQQKQRFNKSTGIDIYKENAEKLFSIEQNLIKTEDELNGLNSEKTKLERQVARLEEELDFGYYFSNLDIKRCPRCEHEINQRKINKEKESHTCFLCDDELDSSSENDKEILMEKIEEQKRHLININAVIDKLKSRISEILTEKKETTILLEENEKNINSWDIEGEGISELADLVEKKIELEIKMKKRDYNSSDQQQIIEHKKDVVNCAINLLNDLRYRESIVILNSFEELILEQINKYGLKNIESVKVRDDMEIIFYQNSVENKFSDLNEGEQLRAKLAVVISLILLDVKYSVGRHPRLLIIDSPGKEEVISRDLIGLASIFKEINKEYEANLQIIIGTALDELKSASIKEKVLSKGKGEVLF